MHNRRSKEVRGLVDFPVDDPAYRNSAEGGMFVRLVVVPNIDDDWMVCCGGENYFLYDECLIGDDIDRGQKDFQSPAQEFHFPHLNEERSSNIYPAASIGYLCVITLGSTGWSGWSDEKNDYFRCRYENLTVEGKKIYDQVQKMYEGKGILYIQTWLDT